MKCAICKTGDLAEGVVTVTLERNGAILVIKDVPAQVCDQCGEYYLDEDTTGRLYAEAEHAFQHNAELEVMRYAA